MLRINTRNLFLCKRWRNWTRKCSYSKIAADFKLDHSIVGYSVKKVEEITELNLTAVLLEHKATKAQHLHLACEDSNNLFGVAFRTPVTSSNGVPHILEHLALCGSRKFPCRDPFFNMLNRSLSTFMNAFTGVDCTMYAFSTQNPKDFQNLLSVYLDAAFYPLLSENDFRQEGWRLEHENIKDKNSPIVIKGIVFNEMKGVFSDPNSYYYYNMQKKLFPSNTYSHISGGVPNKIPELTWEHLKQFHSLHYHPSNSRFFTYGNMPLEQHLEQIERSILQNFQKLEIHNEVPDVIHWNEPKEDHIYNKFDPLAAVPEKQTMISQSFLLGKITNTLESFTSNILSVLLTDGPNAPFYKKFLESGLAPDYSPTTGYHSHLKHGIFSIGVREVAASDINRVKQDVESTFLEVMKTGFSSDRINGVIHAIEIATKHRTAKFGLNCFLNINNVWNHNGCPISSLKVNKHLEWFQQALKDQPHFFQDKILQYFLNNQHKLTLIMSPKESYEHEQIEEEKKLLESKLTSLSDSDKRDIYDKGIELSRHQEKVDASCLPTLKIQDVKRTIEKTSLKFTSIDSIPVQICDQPTNDVVYFKGMIDASNVSEEELMLLPLFCSIITQMGAGKRNYKELDQEIQLKTGAFNASFHLSENPSDPNLFEQGILISSYCLEKNMEDMFALWKDIFNEIDLEDVDRLSQLIKLHASDMAQGIVHHGHMFAMQKASSLLTACANIREKASGLAQISYMKQLAEMENHTAILEKLKMISKKLLHQKFLRCSINTTPIANSSAINCLELFIKEINRNETDFLTPDKVSFCLKEDEKSHFVLPLSVNFLGQSIYTVPYCHDDYACLKVAAKLLSSKFLHSEIREKGGAYGGGAALNKGGHFMFYSYRDPNVDKTLKSFSSGISWLMEGAYSTQDIDEAKLGVFSEIDAPVSPGSKGQDLFQNQITNEMKELLRLHILDCTKEDIISTVERCLKNTNQIGTALVGPENNDTKVSWTVV